MARELTVQLTEGVWRIPLIGDFVNGFLLTDDDGQVTLIDMGIKRSGPKVLAALASLGRAPQEVTRLLLTHAHPDHAGGAAYVAAATSREVGIHAEDAPYARTGRGPARDPNVRLGRLMDRIAPTTYDPVPVDHELTDGELLPVAGGLRVIHTPGHSPGHVSFLHEPSRLLITGDAIFNVRGLRWPVKAFCHNFAMTTATAHRLIDIEYDVAAFTHGPELRDRPREAIRRFLARESPGPKGA